MTSVGGSKGTAASEQLTKMPHVKNRAKQQTLPHFYAQQSTLSVSVALIIIAIICIPLGAAVIIESDRIFEIDVRYDHINKYTYTEFQGEEGPVVFEFNNTNFSTGKVANVSFTLPKSLTAPVYLQYKLVGFHQNFRPYSISMDQNQLRGQQNKVVDDCEPFRYPGEVFGESITGYYNPCGSVAWSLFNDTISLFNQNHELICDGAAFTYASSNINPNNKCHKRGIAMKSDLDHRFKSVTESDLSSESMKKSSSKNNNANNGPMWSAMGSNNSNNPFLAKGYYYKEAGHKIPWGGDEDFIVWANSNYIANFAKMYRVIDVDLPAGEYYFTIIELFDVHSINGEKHVRLVTRTWIGGRNYVLGIMLTVVGGLAFVFVLTIHVMRCTSYPRRIRGEWHSSSDIYKHI